MNRLPLIALALLLTLPTRAQDQPALLSLTVHPAAPPFPALKYRLTPQHMDLVPGNAALLYLTAAQRYAAARTTNDNADEQQVTAWLAAPLGEMPKDKAKALLDRHASALHHVRLATLRDRCDFDPPYRSEGFRTHLPYLQEARTLAKLLALQARHQIATGEYDAAVASIGQGFTQSRHLTSPAFLVQSLVSAGIAGMMLDQALELAQQPNAPNLYWALGDLPKPLVDPRDSMRFEYAGLYYSVPALQAARHRQLSTDEWTNIFDTLASLQTEMGNPRQPTKRAADVANHPATLEAARAFLLRTQTPEALKPLSNAQLVGSYHLAHFEYWLQETDKWTTHPFPVAYPRLVKVDQAIAAEARANPTPVSVFIPAVSKAYLKLATYDRRAALLRTIEAVRAYAVSHAGKPPETLADLTDTPAPLDPLTNRPFHYERADDKAILEAPEIPNATGTKTHTRYEIRVRT